MPTTDSPDPLLGAGRLRLGSGDRIGALRWGDGPLRLVFVHANGFCASTYATLLAPLAGPDTGVVAIDLRGHGTTTLPADPARLTSWDRHASDITAALDDPRLALDSAPVLAGHSMGATSALLAAGATAGLASRLVLLDPVLMPQPAYWALLLPGAPRRLQEAIPIARGALKRRSVFDSRDQAIASWRGRGAFKDWQPGFLEGYCADGLRDAAGGGVSLACAPAWEAACYGSQRHDPYAALEKVKVPLSVLAAQSASTVTPAGLGLLKRARADVRVVEGTTHFLPMSHPDIARAALETAIA